MSPITHLLASWAAGEASALDQRDRSLLAWAGLASDLDGLGAVVDLGNRALGRPDSFWYSQFHHQLLHGIFGSVVLAAAFAFAATRRSRVFVLVLAVTHLHFLLDFVGSRGPDAADIWPIHYLAPFSQRLTFAWEGQWALNSWPNIAFTLALITFAFYRAATAGTSPVSLFSQRGHLAFVEAVRRRVGAGKGST